MTDTVTFSVKWGKEIIALDFVVAGGVKGLKAELEEKTCVPAERMKLMAKSKGLWKGVLKNDFEFSTIDFVNALSKAKGGPLSLLLMGSASELSRPKTKTVFLEDLPTEEAAKVKEPSGLENLGNTCYLNSVVQCLRTVPQFRRVLDSSTVGPTSAPSMFVISLRDTFNQLDRTTEPVAPSNLVRVTKMAFPEFNRTGPNGTPLQQDAEEFFSGLLMLSSRALKGDKQIKAALPSTTPSELGDASNVIDALFGLKMEETLTCDEFDDERSVVNDENDDKIKVDDGKTESTLVELPVKSYDLLRKLVCNIQGGSDGSTKTNVTHLAQGIALSLNGSIKKRSDILGRDAIWTRKQRITRLPPILTVQFGRFYWKATPDSQDHAGVKCKVMKPVAFNSTFDIYEFCTDSVKKVLKKSRGKALKEEEDRVIKNLKGESEEDVKMSTDDDDDDAAALQAAIELSINKEGHDDEKVSIGPGLPSEFQGHYELFAVVSHKGRNADGGHYMAWVKAASNSGKVEKIVDTDEENEDWFVFDDDEVSPCKTEDVLKLKGGGDWHMSYLNFYRAKK